jgi:hypothetical protein
VYRRMNAARAPTEAVRHSECSSAASNGPQGAALHSLRYVVFWAPTSFLAFAFFRHAVRFACLAAASLGGGAVGAAVGAAGVRAASAA